MNDEQVKGLRNIHPGNINKTIEKFRNEGYVYKLKFKDPFDAHDFIHDYCHIFCMKNHARYLYFKYEFELNAAKLLI